MPSGGRTGHQQQSFRVMEMALIWGGRLMVMAPLYSISTQSPREKQQARWVWTRRGVAWTS